MLLDILIVSVFGNTGNKRSSPDYYDEDYDGDLFAPKKVVLQLVLMNIYMNASDV